MLQADYGLYTWPSSFVLARHLWRHRERYLRVVPDTDTTHRSRSSASTLPNTAPFGGSNDPSSSTLLSSSPPSNRRRGRPTRVLELGAGTALPGLLLAKLGARVTLTDAADQPEVLANLEAACRDNELEVVAWPEQSSEQLASLEFGAAATAAAAAATGASSSTVSVCGLSWGTTDAAALRLASRSFDLVIGADVLYSKGRDFDRLLATARRGP